MLGPMCELFETVYECQRLVEKYYKLIDSREVTGLSVGFIGDDGVTGDRLEGDISLQC